MKSGAAFEKPAGDAAELFMRLEKLDREYNCVLLLYYTLGFTWQELSRLLHLDPKTLRSRRDEAFSILIRKE